MEIILQILFAYFGLAAAIHIVNRLRTPRGAALARNCVEIFGSANRFNSVEHFKGSQIYAIWGTNSAPVTEYLPCKSLKVTDGKTIIEILRGWSEYDKNLPIKFENRVWVTVDGVLVLDFISHESAHKIAVNFCANDLSWWRFFEPVGTRPTLESIGDESPVELKFLKVG